MTPIRCPLCGLDDTEPMIGDGYLCLNCGHVFTVIAGKVQEMEDDDDGEQ